MHPAGAADVDCGKSNKKGERRNDLEINERFDSHPAYFFKVSVAGDSHHKSGEKQRSDDHFDQPKKNIAEYLQLYGGGRPVVADFDASDHSNQNPGSKRAFGCGVCGENCDCDPPCRGAGPGEKWREGEKQWGVIRQGKRGCNDRRS